MRSRTGTRTAIALLTLAISLLLTVAAAPAQAAVSLNTSLLTWGVIGLDSNDVTTGPNLFPVGVRACNTGSTAATSGTARLVWDSANPYLNVQGPATVSFGTLAAGSCRDAYVNVAVTRTAAAYLTARRFHMTVTAGGVTSRTPTRELYVEKLISQNRNQVLGISGPSTMVLGESYTIVVNAETAPGGYEQVEAFLTLPTGIFRIDGVTMTATAGKSPVSQPYIDACTWVSDPTSADYRECTGTAKAGGSMTITYRVTVIGTGSGTASTLVYDFSGSSYHYNSDFGTAPNLFPFRTVAPDLTVTKSHGGTSWVSGSNGTFGLLVRNVGTAATTEPITVVDTLPAGLTFVSATGGGFSCTHTGQTVRCVRATALAAGASATITLTVRAAVSTARTVTNVVTVTTPNDVDTTNNRDTDSVPVTVPAVVAPVTRPGTTPGVLPGATPGATAGPGTGPSTGGTSGAAGGPSQPGSSVPGGSESAARGNLPNTGLPTTTLVQLAGFVMLGGLGMMMMGANLNGSAAQVQPLRPRLRPLEPQVLVDLPLRRRVRVVPVLQRHAEATATVIIRPPADNA